MTAQPTLLGWLGKTGPPTKEPVAVCPRSLSPPRPAPPPRIVLGVLGTRNAIRYEDFEETVLGPTVEAWGLPDEVLTAAEGDSTQVILQWAKLHEIPVRLVTADWIRHAKRAGLLRDAHIQREATHLLLLQGPRSNALTTLAMRLDRKGRPVVISPRPGKPVVAPIALLETDDTK